MSTSPTIPTSDGHGLVVLLNGQQLARRPGGLDHHSGEVCCPGELLDWSVLVKIGYSTRGVRYVSVDFEGEDRTLDLRPVKDHPPRGVKFAGNTREGVGVEVEILPLRSVKGGR